MTRILITGGTGFVGHHHVNHYLDKTDWDVVILDGLTYAGDVTRATDIEGYDPERVSIFWHDLRSPIGPGLDERIGAIDYVVSMASDSHVDRSIAEPARFIHNNVMVATNLLEWCKRRAWYASQYGGDDRNEPHRYPAKAIMHVSTDEVFGPAPEGYSHKEWDPALPSNPYAASKAAQDAIFFSYWRTYDLPIVITHTMNMFGERQGSEKFIPIVVRNLLAGTPVPVHAGRPVHEEFGNPGELIVDDGYWEAGSRVWLHARNHADATVYILERLKVPLYSEGNLDKPLSFNIAGERDIKNDEMVRIIADILGVEPNIEYKDFHKSRPGHDLRYSLDGSKLLDVGWRPPVSFEEGLAKTIKWSMGHPEWN